MKQPPIKITCPECGGRGFTGDLKDLDMPFIKELCLSCKGTGEVYNYLTPEQREAETGEKMLDSDFVWCFVGGGWYLHEYEDTSKNNIRVVYVKKQPKPDNDWRPNENM